MKWLSRIDAVTAPFEGYQQAVAYRYQREESDPGEPVTRMRVRALMIPPGHPDFLTWRRFVEAGTVAVRGRAWSGEGEVVTVEFAVDGEWADADLQAPVGRFARCGWSYDWRAAPGGRVLSCRATDAAGHTQPLEQPWNYRGMGNNLVQTVEVTVADR
ncbi:MAG TPA: hypothetical protein VJ787_12695 [Thermoleophilia bacterium]|nr:hypothetical protein [Thermoleophilia bacterium]